MPAYDFGFVSLDIHWVNSEDSGVYTCRATNDYGEDSTSATVKCRRKMELSLSVDVRKNWHSVGSLL